MSDRVARDLVIHGRVQGVFFRAFIRDAADRVGVAGHAENRADGTVTVHLEGAADAVAKVERACRIGPEGAHVDHVDASDAAVEGRSDFSVS
jgi:acylphosphatase